MASIQKRKTKAGHVCYRVQVRLKGYPLETASFERLTDARRWAQKIEAAMREGRHFTAREAKRYTMADTIDRYCEDVLEYRENPINQKTYLSWWKKALGAYRLIDITPALIVEHRNALVGSKNRFGRSIGTSTANRYTQALGHVLNTAMKEWNWIEKNPVEQIRKYKETKGRVRFLSDDERFRLFVACKASENPYLYMIVVLALSTGARKMEILNLKWRHIDLKGGKVLLDRTKNGERRVIPLQGYALNLMNKLEKVRALNCDYVFPSADKCQPIDIRTAWENALVRAGVDDFRFHDLRHSAASYLAMNGATLIEIADVLGHKTLQMVKRYAHLSEAHTISVVASMNDKIFGDLDNENKQRST